MAEITDPIVTFQIKLKRRYYLRVMVWATREDMHANTPDDARKDFDAIFSPGSGRCIGTIHLGAHDVSSSTRAHEVMHAIDEYDHRAYSETRGHLTEHVMAEITKTLTGLQE